MGLYFKKLEKEELPVGRFYRGRFRKMSNYVGRLNLLY